MEYQRLQSLPLFRGMKEEEIRELLEKNNLRSQELHKGKILSLQDEPCNRLILLLTGSVKAEMSDPSGKTVKVEDIIAPAPLAILFLFGENNRFPVQATTREKSNVLIIPKSTVLKMLGSNETFLKNYLDTSANFATRLSQKLHLMSFRTIRQKMALYLLELGRQQNQQKVVLDQSRTALAEYFAVSRPSLEREISKMQQDGLITIEKKEITLLDETQLYRIISF